MTAQKKVFLMHAINEAICYRYFLSWVTEMKLIWWILGKPGALLIGECTKMFTEALYVATVTFEAGHTDLLEWTSMNPTHPRAQARPVHACDVWCWIACLPVRSMGSRRDVRNEWNKKKCNFDLKKKDKSIKIGYARKINCSAALKFPLNVHRCAHTPLSACTSTKRAASRMSNR